jgi:hypothetical protein
LFPWTVKDEEDSAKLLDPAAVGVAEGTPYEGLGEKKLFVLPWLIDEDEAELLDPTAAGAAEGTVYEGLGGKI